MPIRLSRVASRSAPIFVRQNTSTGPVASSRSQLREPLRLLARRHRLDGVRDRLRRSAAAADLHVLRIAQELLRQLQHFARHRRREEQRLAHRRQRRQDALHVGPEAHVEHAVGFVEHQHLEAGEVHRVVPHVIHQPARRGDDDVDAGRSARSCMSIGTPP